MKYPSVAASGMLAITATRLDAVEAPQTGRARQTARGTEQPGGALTEAVLTMTRPTRTRAAPLAVRTVVA